MRKNINNIQRKLKEYFDTDFLTREKVIELLTEALLEDVGDLNTLDTNTKDLIVNAINEIIPNSIINQYNELITIMDQKKQLLVDILASKGVSQLEGISISSSWSDIISKVYDLASYEYKDVNVYKFKVEADDLITLYNDMRGDTFAGEVYTDWGDGNINTELTHTYTTAGTYIVKSKYSINRSTDGTGTIVTKRCLVDVLDINKNMTTLKYFCCACEAITVINADHWITDNITSMFGMFSHCDKLVAVYMDKCDVSKVTDNGQMFHNCPLLYY